MSRLSKLFSYKKPRFSQSHPKKGIKNVVFFCRESTYRSDRESTYRTDDSTLACNNTLKSQVICRYSSSHLNIKRLQCRYRLRVQFPICLVHIYTRTCRGNASYRSNYSTGKTHWIASSLFMEVFKLSQSYIRTSASVPRIKAWLKFDFTRQVFIH